MNLPIHYKVDLLEKLINIFIFFLVFSSLFKKKLTTQRKLGTIIDDIYWQEDHWIRPWTFG